MLSTIDKELKIINTAMTIVPKEYPNGYGIENIGFIWHGEWSDPYIEYNEKQLNSTIIEDSMWSQFKEDFPNGTENEFDDYMRENIDDVFMYIECALEE